MKRLREAIIVVMFIITITLALGINRVSAVEDPAVLFEGIKLAKSYKSLYFHNPIMTQRFGADPYAMVYKDRVYVYMTNDILQKDSKGKILENDYGKIHTINRLSSADLVNWTDHGTIEIAGFSGEANWAENSWAPAAVHKK